MASLNKATLIGRVGKDPETRYTAGGKAVASFSVATEKTWKDKSDQKQEKTTWHNVIAWGKLAEIIEKYVSKGMLVYIEGEIGLEEWTGKDGGKRQKPIITANTLQMLSGGKDKKENTGPADHGPADDDFIPEEEDVPL